MSTPLTGRTIVCLGSMDWDSPPNVPQQTMRRLAADHRIVYVNPQRNLLDWLLAKLGRRKVPSPSFDEVHPGVFVWNFPAMFLPSTSLPAWLARLTGRWNARTMAHRIERKLASFGATAPILWIYSVHGAHLIGRLPARLTVYDCIDEWAGYLPEGRFKRNVISTDTALCRQCDVVFVGSRSMLASKGRFNASTHFVPHAADFALFSTATSDATAIPDDVARIPRPRIGLTGVLEKRIDTGMLVHAAASHPEWSLVLVGPVWDNLDTTPLRALPNVHFLGRKPVGELPGYIKAFDVCTIPYRIDDFVRNIYPLKLHEYLASGKPIVCTRIPAVMEFEHLVRIVDTPEEFRLGVERALQESDAALREERIRTAAANTWEHRVAAKSRLIFERLAHSTAPSTG